jgi:pimeloyl-ACP methyl ester carboxylesterase
VTRRRVRSADGTPIAVFATGEPDGRPLVLVHGTTADHTAFRAIGPLLARSFAVHAIDRRGRGGSGDGPAYSIEREFEDLAAVADRLAHETGRAVDVVGHSLGGRIALGAALWSAGIGRLVVYEGAPPPGGARYEARNLVPRLRALLEVGDADMALETFFRTVVGMDDAAIRAYRAGPTWPIRVAAAGTIPREIEGAAAPAASLDVLGAVSKPVLQVLGGASRPIFRRATEALDARLADGRVVVVEGAAHAAHHTHAEEFVAVVRSFLVDAA